MQRLGLMWLKPLFIGVHRLQGTAFQSIKAAELLWKMHISKKLQKNSKLCLLFTKSCRSDPPLSQTEHLWQAKLHWSPIEAFCKLFFFCSESCSSAVKRLIHVMFSAMQHIHSGIISTITAFNRYVLTISRWYSYGWNLMFLVIPLV